MKMDKNKKFNKNKREIKEIEEDIDSDNMEINEDIESVDDEVNDIGDSDIEDDFEADNNETMEEEDIASSDESIMNSPEKENIKAQINEKLKEKLLEIEEIIFNENYSNTLKNKLNLTKKAQANTKANERIDNLEKKTIHLFNKVLETLYKVCPDYKTSANLINEQVIEDAIKNVGSDYSGEAIMNKMWQPISLANTKLQRSMFLLEGDKTFLEAINIEQAKEKEREKLKTMFHSYYMDQVTSSFGDDLDKLREEEDFTNSKLQILIDSLQQGICIFSDSDKELILSTNGNQMESD